MNKIGFDNDKYLSMQSEHIRDRIEQFGGKLYLEFGVRQILEEMVYNQIGRAHV